MTETALAKPTHAVPDVMTLGTVFARSGYFQDARDAAQAVVKMLAGQELGFGPVASMTGIYIVKGRVTLSANLLAAAVKKGGKYNYRVVELTDAACKIDFYEGKEKVGESSFTMQDAQAAGLVNENYKKFSRNMLFARAMSNGAKWFCADVFSGPVYTPDELGATIDMETGEMLARPEDDPAYEGSAEDAAAPRSARGVATPVNAELSKYGDRDAPKGKVCPVCGSVDTIRKSKKDGGWYCWKRLDGCGVTWPAGPFPTEAPADLAKPGIASAEQAEAEGNALFGDDERMERNALLGKIKAAADMRKLSTKERVALWDTHCPGATAENVDVSALHALLGALVAK